MSATLRVPGLDVPIEVRRSARARRLTLRIGVEGPVMTVPKRLALRHAQAFAEDRRNWIASALARQPAIIAVGEGVALPIDGIARRIVAGQGDCLHADRLELGGAPEHFPKRAANFLRNRARAKFEQLVPEYAAAVKRPFGRISLRDTRSRWGSCSAAGNLMFSWRLALAPPEILAYVAAHEAAHLVHMHHQPSYWAELARIRPGYARERDWLRQNGSDLHRYRFDT